jgi:hypothetical protein
MLGSRNTKQQDPSEDDASLVIGLDLPRDVWGLILAAAAAPLRHMPDDLDGRSNVARWRALALVCKQ